MLPSGFAALATGMLPLRPSPKRISPVVRFRHVVKIRRAGTEEIVHARPYLGTGAFVDFEPQGIAQHRSTGEAKHLIAPAVAAAQHFVPHRLGLAHGNGVGANRQQASAGARTDSARRARESSRVPWFQAR